jgi:hypothetical protein
MSGVPHTIFIPEAIPVATPAKRIASDAVLVGRLAGLLIPSLGSAIFVIILLNILFLSEGTRTLFRDGDTGWHISTGESIVRAAVVPAADSFSLIHAGREWFAWEWLADVALGGAHLALGPSGVALLAALVIALTGWAAWRLALSLGANIFLTFAMLVPMLGTTSIHWLARPHIFSWLLGLCFIVIAERHRRGLGAARLLRILPLLSCLWANVHGSFLLGTALLLAYAVGEWLRGRAGAPAGRRFSMAAVAALQVHQHILAYLRNDYLMDHISEFRSFSFHAPGAMYVELFLMLAAVGTVYLFRQKSYGPGLLSLALMHMSLYSARHLPMYAILMSPIFVAAISAEWNLHPQFQKMARYSRRLLAIERQVIGAVPTGVGVLIIVIAMRAQHGQALSDSIPESSP